MRAHDTRAREWGNEKEGAKTPGTGIIAGAKRARPHTHTAYLNEARENADRSPREKKKEREKHKKRKETEKKNKLPRPRG